MATQEEYQSALEKIAKAVATDDSGGWTDMAGILETVGYICEDAGIDVPHAGID